MCWLTKHTILKYKHFPLDIIYIFTIKISIGIVPVKICAKMIDLKSDYVINRLVIFVRTNVYLLLETEHIFSLFQFRSPL